MSPAFADPAEPSLPLHLVDEAGSGAFLNSLPAPAGAWLTAAGFTGKLGQTAPWPGADGAPAGAAFGLGTPAARARGRLHAARAAADLPAGVWHIASLPDPALAEEVALAWLFAGYRFDRYKAAGTQGARLKAPSGVDPARILSMAEAEFLTRDLINTPASDMGPDELEAALHALADRFGARVQAIRGDDLLAQNFPMIHAVGRASTRAPRLLDMTWGDTGPAVTLVGKGVCFDTGGLDIKPASGMGLMKKDMGGAATTMGLARMIMAARLPVRLRLIVPAVENAIGGNAFRPQDILTSRKGLTVEVNNTDAEGRLILADALALADEGRPDLILSMATLTGAARVAVGPDLAPFYCDDDAFAAALEGAASRMADPVWRMPFWPAYEGLIEPGIADLDNAPSGGFAGSITAALFLRRFVTETPRYAHFDIYGWTPSAQPGRPKGGVGQGARAVFDALPEYLGL